MKFFTFQHNVEKYGMWMWKSVFCTKGKNILSKKIQINLFNIFKYPGGNSPSFIWEMKAKLAKTMCVKYDL